MVATIIVEGEEVVDVDVDGRAVGVNGSSNIWQKDAKKEDGNRPKGCASCAVAVLTILGFIGRSTMQLKSFFDGGQEESVLKIQRQ
jgi:hypothetical protein